MTKYYYLAHFVSSSCVWNVFDLKYLYIIDLQVDIILFQNAGELFFLHGIYIWSLFGAYVGKAMMVQRRI